MDLTGLGDGRLLKCGAPVIDYATGLTWPLPSHRLFQREREGRGHHIDVSMLDVAMTLMTSHCTSSKPRASGGCRRLWMTISYARGGRS